MRIEEYREATERLEDFRIWSMEERLNRDPYDHSLRFSLGMAKQVKVLRKFSELFKSDPNTAYGFLFENQKGYVSCLLDPEMGKTDRKTMPISLPIVTAPNYSTYETVIDHSGHIRVYVNSGGGDTWGGQ